MTVAPERDIILISGQAFTPEQYAAWRRERDRDNARRRERRASDPEYAERYRAYQRDYRRTHADRLRDYHREWSRHRRRTASISAGARRIAGSLHDLRCSNDPCICTPVRGWISERTDVRPEYNTSDGISVTSTESGKITRGPAVLLIPGGRAVDVSSGIRR